MLNAAYDEGGNHLVPFDVRVVGNVDVFIDVMHQCDINAHITHPDTGPVQLTLLPPQTRTA